MAQTLREFLDDREAAIVEQMKALKIELQELRTAKSALDDGKSSNALPQQSKRTHREMIISVLTDAPHGLTSDKVIEQIKSKFSVPIPQASMSSQLSRAKSDGAVMLDLTTKVWRLHLKASKENEPPVGGSGMVEVDASTKGVDQVQARTLLDY